MDNFFGGKVSFFGNHHKEEILRPEGHLAICGSGSRGSLWCVRAHAQDYFGGIYKNNLGPPIGTKVGSPIKKILHVFFNHTKL